MGQRWNERRSRRFRIKSKTKTGNISFDLKRFAVIKRDYTKEEVEKLKGTFNIEYTLCKLQSEKLWNLLNTEPYVQTLGSLSDKFFFQLNDGEQL